MKELVQLLEGFVAIQTNICVTENDTSLMKFKWVQTKIGGIRFAPRCSMPATTAPNNLSAYCFGGVFDTEDEESIAGTFFNDFYHLDLEKLIWRNTILTEKKEKDTKMRRKVKNDVSEDRQVERILEEIESTTISDDGIFRVTIGPSQGTSSNNTAPTNAQSTSIFQPSPRMNCGLAIKHGIMYLYGGMFEDGDKQYTFNDFYALDLKKMDEWKILVADDMTAMEWFESESGSGDEKDKSEEESSDSEMETE